MNLKNNMTEYYFKRGYTMNCICCNKEIRLIDSANKLEQGMWDGGIVDKIAASFGSKLDGNMYIIAICDECVKEKEERLIYIGDYMMNEHDPDYDKIHEAYKE